MTGVQILAAVHVTPWIAAPLGAAVGLALGWLWWWQGREGVPRSRRAIRRASLLLALVAVPLTVHGLSFVDPAVDPRGYAQTWSVVLVILGLIVVTAAVDAVNSFRIHAADERADARGAAQQLVRSIADRAAERDERRMAEIRAARGQPNVEDDRGADRA